MGHGPPCGGRVRTAAAPEPTRHAPGAVPPPAHRRLNGNHRGCAYKNSLAGAGGPGWGLGGRAGGCTGHGSRTGPRGVGTPLACISHPRAESGWCCCPTPRRLPAEPMWTEWGAWGSCSRSCGSTGTRVRRRSCQNARKLLCAGHPSEVQQCPPTPCPGTCPGDAEMLTPVPPQPRLGPAGAGGREQSAPCRPAACPEHTLQGAVVSAAGAALPDARVYLEGRPPVLLARSDTRGAFRVTGLCVNIGANVSAHRDGFAPGLAPVVSNGTGLLVAHIVLQKLGEH